MNLLLDTHILIWALNDDPRLPERAKELILNEANVIYYSSVSIWEVSIKHSVHPENVSFSGEQLAGYCREAGFLPVDMKETHVFALNSLERTDGAKPHHDPFDRMLIAQAKAENMSFVTHDVLLSDYRERCILLV